MTEKINIWKITTIIFFIILLLMIIFLTENKYYQEKNKEIIIPDSMSGFIYNLDKSEVVLKLDLNNEEDFHLYTLIAYYCKMNKIDKCTGLFIDK